MIDALSLMSPAARYMAVRREGKAEDGMFILQRHCSRLTLFQVPEHDVSIAAAAPGRESGRPERIRLC